MSISITPSPWHASQRPPFTLNENRPGVKPRIRDSGCGNSSSNLVKAPRYEAGFERGERPIGD